MDLDSLKYVELRRLAKNAGLKANMKADKLLKALKQHYQNQQQDNTKCVVEIESYGKIEALNENDVTLVQEHPEFTTPVFVTKRRGKCTKNKRKISESKCASELSCSPLKVIDEVVVSTGIAKRRRLSSDDNGATSLAVEEPDHAADKQKLVNDEVPVVCDGGEEPKYVKPGKIPRLKVLIKRTPTVRRANTPNFKKLHEAHFNNMESLDSYVQRKTMQMESYGASVKELKLLSDTTLKPLKTKAGSPCRSSLLSPSPSAKRPATDKRRHTQVPARKPTKDVVPFKPSVLSTRRINVRFSQATNDNEHKKTMVKTPASKSLSVERGTTPVKKSETTKKDAIIKTMPLSTTKTPGAVFVFNGNTSVSNTPGTNKKSNFDLKASLSRPLGYKPHKGKLKPFGVNQENAVGNSVINQSQQKNPKQHKVQTRDERRNKYTDDRKQKKDNLLGARRGLVLT